MRLVQDYGPSNRRGTMQSYATNRIRSFSLIGHGGVGKTSIADVLAAFTGATASLGRVDDHSSVLDDTPEEHKKGGSLATSYLTIESDGYKFHVVDTPEDGNFLHESRTALQAANGAVLVLSATAGVEVSTEQMNGFAAAQRIPRVLFINRMDKDSADHAIGDGRGRVRPGDAARAAAAPHRQR
ncbi:MAG: elongation factor G [Myxococcota bacterium]